MSSLITTAGTAVTLRRRPERPAAPTREQVIRMRNEDWRRDHDEGALGPDGVVRPRSLRLIARIAGCSVTKVREGIASARRLREALAHALDRD